MHCESAAILPAVGTVWPPAIVTEVAPLVIDPDKSEAFPKPLTVHAPCMIAAPLILLLELRYLLM